MKVTRLAGHTLPNEGRIYENGYRITEGPTACSCGEQSPVFCSDSGRRNWHRDFHKPAVATQGR